MVLRVFTIISLESCVVSIWGLSDLKTSLSLKLSVPIRATYSTDHMFDCIYYYNGTPMITLVVIITLITFRMDVMSMKCMCIWVSFIIPDEKGYPDNPDSPDSPDSPDKNLIALITLITLIILGFITVSDLGSCGWNVFIRNGHCPSTRPLWYDVYIYVYMYIYIYPSN